MKIVRVDFIFEEVCRKDLDKIELCFDELTAASGVYDVTTKQDASENEISLSRRKKEDRLKLGDMTVRLHFSKIANTPVIYDAIRVFLERIGRRSASVGVGGDDENDSK